MIIIVPNIEILTHNYTRTHKNNGNIANNKKSIQIIVVITIITINIL